MTHKQRNEFFDQELDKCRKIWCSKGLEYSNSTEDANLNFKSDSEIGITQLQSVSVFMNKHYRSIRSYVKNGEVKSNEPIESRLHDLIVYSLIMLSVIKENDNTTSNIEV